ncbi:hypothetical protein GCM10010261_67280 [Streptomyces pilosus]|nr:hypothetical protein GCM10010261_67280 [Streptomyces pilosus]
MLFQPLGPLRPSTDRPPHPRFRSGKLRPIGAAQAASLDNLPGIRLPDLAELRARGVPGARPPAARRVLGAGSNPDTDPSDSSI